MRRGEHRTRGIEDAGRVVHHVGRGETQIDDVDPLLHHPAGELVDEFLAGLSHVACDENAIGVDQLRETDSEGVRDFSMELIGHRASDVVRLDDFIQY